VAFIAEDEFTTHQFFNYLAVIAWVYHGCLLRLVGLGG
jgi:hypothetical protein